MWYGRAVGPPFPSCRRRIATITNSVSSNRHGFSAHASAIRRSRNPCTHHGAVAPAAREDTHAAVGIRVRPVRRRHQMKENGLPDVAALSAAFSVCRYRSSSDMPHALRIGSRRPARSTGRSRRSRYLRRKPPCCRSATTTVDELRVVATFAQHVAERPYAARGPIRLTIECPGVGGNDSVTASSPRTVRVPVA
jgi:hypothetical protein